MKVKTLLTGLLAISILYSCQESQPGKKSVELNTKLDSVSYAWGLTLGRNIKRNGMGEINYEALSQAIEDILSDSEIKIESPKANYLYPAIEKCKMGKTPRGRKDFLGREWCQRRGCYHRNGIAIHHPQTGRWP